MSKRVVVIGAGIVGVSAAIWARRDGHEVTLIDREGPAAGASYGNGGVLAAAAVLPVSTPGLLRKVPGMLLNPDRPLFLKWRYLPRALPYLLRFLRHANATDARKRAEAMARIVADSLEDHQTLARGTGAERWIVPSDYVFLYPDRAAFEADAFTWSVRRDLGFDWDELEGSALREFDPGFGPAIGFAARLPRHGRISDPGAYVTALADHLRASGGQILTAEVTDIAVENGHVTGVRAGGERIDCDAVVVAAGVWSGGLVKRLGIDVPLESERGYHLELWNPSMMPRNPVMVSSGSFVATPMEGRLRLAGIVEIGGLDAPPSEAPFALLERQAKAAMPGLSWERATRWMGHRPAIADSVPLIGEVPGAKGAVLAFGHDHIGLTGGPKTGRLVAQLISERHPNIDMTPYAPGRFARRRA